MDPNRVPPAHIVETDYEILNEVQKMENIASIRAFTENVNLPIVRTTTIYKSALQEVTRTQAAAGNSDFKNRQNNHFPLQENARVREMFSAYSEQPVITLTGEIHFQSAVSSYVSKYSLQKATLLENFYHNLGAVNNTLMPIQHTPIDQATRHNAIREMKFSVENRKPNIHFNVKSPINENYMSERNQSSSALGLLLTDSTANSMSGATKTDSKAAPFPLQAHSLVREIFSASSEQPVITLTGKIPSTPIVSSYVSKHSLQKTPQESLYHNLGAANYNTYSMPIQHTEVDGVFKQYKIKDANLIAKTGKPTTNLLAEHSENENYESDRNVSGSVLRRFTKELNLPAKSPIKKKSRGEEMCGSVLRGLLTDSISYGKPMMQCVAKNDSQPVLLEMVNTNAATNRMSTKDYSKSVVMENIERDEVMPDFLEEFCEICGLNFSVSSFRGHCKIHHGNEAIACEKCGKCFATFTGLRTHNTNH